MDFYPHEKMDISGLDLLKKTTLLSSIYMMELKDKLVTFLAV
jgi:hypothetical protein